MNMMPKISISTSESRIHTKGGRKMMKGITPVIAIIVLLLITVALAGAAWAYFQTYWTGMTAKGMEVTDSYCIGADTAVVVLRNTGTQSITPLTEITVIDQTTGNAIAVSFTDMDGTSDANSTAMSPGDVWQMRNVIGAGTYQGYRLQIGSRSMPASVQC